VALPIGELPDDSCDSPRASRSAQASPAAPDPSRLSTTRAPSHLQRRMEGQLGIHAHASGRVDEAIRELRRIVDPELVRSPRRGREVAIAVSLPNLNERSRAPGAFTSASSSSVAAEGGPPKTARCLMLGIDRPDRGFATLGLSALLYVGMNEADGGAASDGASSRGRSRTTTPSTTGSRRPAPSRYKTYRIYGAPREDLPTGVTAWDRTSRRLSARRATSSPSRAIRRAPSRHRAVLSRPRTARPGARLIFDAEALRDARAPTRSHVAGLIQARRESEFHRSTLGGRTRSSRRRASAPDFAASSSSRARPREGPRSTASRAVPTPARPVSRTGGPAEGERSSSRAAGDPARSGRRSSSGARPCSGASSAPWRAADRGGGTGRTPSTCPRPRRRAPSSSR
jgi:hypothetical protein